MEPKLETHFMGCLQDLCSQSDVFHTAFRKYLCYEVRKACLAGMQVGVFKDLRNIIA
jgi:hypothetical protein